MDTSMVAPRHIIWRVLGFIFGGIPTVLILAAIAAFGWYGHEHGWKVPKFSELNGVEEKKGDWCEAHGVPESICVECKPELMPKSKPVGWCKIHGIPECTLCNPSLSHLSSIPVVTAEQLVRAKRSLDFNTRPENNPICKTQLRRIQLADTAAVEKTGIAVETVRTGTAIEFVSASGELLHDPTRVTHLSSRSPGSVWRVLKHLGEAVKAGEILALIDAAEVGKAKTELLQAFALLQIRMQTLTAKRTANLSDSALREAEATVREVEIRLDAARQTLVNLGLPLGESELKQTTPEILKARLQRLGLPDDLVKTLNVQSTTANLLPIVAPMDGVIVSRDIVAGEVVDLAKILFEVVDNRAMWLTCDVRGEDVSKLRVGQPLRFKLDSSTDEITGTLAWISTQIDPKTRTVKVRANIPNREGLLRANSFGSARVILREEADVVSIPNEALQSDGCCTLVFVRDKSFLSPESPKVFHIRKVRTGAKSETHTEIIAGLLPGERIVTKGSGALLAELMKGELGDGCGCH